MKDSYVRLSEVRFKFLAETSVYNSDLSAKALAFNVRQEGLTTQAQRPGAWDATIATAPPPPGSLHCMVWPLNFVHCEAKR